MLLFLELILECLLFHEHHQPFNPKHTKNTRIPLKLYYHTSQQSWKDSLSCCYFMMSTNWKWHSFHGRYFNFHRGFSHVSVTYYVDSYSWQETQLLSLKTQYVWPQETLHYSSTGEDCMRHQDEIFICYCTLKKIKIKANQNFKILMLRIESIVILGSAHTVHLMRYCIC